MARKLGLKVAPPSDLRLGGMDFESKEQVERLKEQLEDWHSSGVKLVLHLAPPCRTFSRARDRCAKTRLRSFNHPEGLATLSGWKKSLVKSQNCIAEHALDLAAWAASRNAIVTLENPKDSYLWRLPASTNQDPAKYTDAL